MALYALRPTAFIARSGAQGGAGHSASHRVRTSGWASKLATEANRDHGLGYGGPAPGLSPGPFRDR